MVRYVTDSTGKFTERPHYEPKELDLECEKIICAYLKEKHGKTNFPIGTEDLKNLIERDASDLDCYSDLSEYGSDVEGMTEFLSDRKPMVRISKLLTEDSRYENRLRTTLTHEYGHIHLHSYLFKFNQPPKQFPQTKHNGRLICKRDTMVGAPTTNWMEWQAGYVCGAILMPKSYVLKIVRQNPSQKAEEYISLIAEQFKVSREAAKIRLLKLEILAP